MFIVQEAYEKDGKKVPLYEEEYDRSSTAHGEMYLSGVRISFDVLHAKLDNLNFSPQIYADSPMT